MNKLKYFCSKKFLKKIIGLLFAILTIMSACIAIYSHFHEKQPNISFNILSEYNILDVKTPVDDLIITFRGNDIQKQKQNFKLYLISIKNNGEKDILQGDYDRNNIWGIRIKNSEIIETPQIISSNSTYLKNNFNPKISKKDTVQFSKVIFEKNKHIVISIKILHNMNKKIKIRPIGKIAGIEDITINSYSLDNKKEGLWFNMLTGNLIIQFGRILIYSFIFIILLVFLTIPLFLFNKIKTKYLITKWFAIHPASSDKDKIYKKIILDYCKAFFNNLDYMEEFLLLFNNTTYIKKFEQLIENRTLQEEILKDKNTYFTFSDLENWNLFCTYQAHAQDKFFTVNKDNKIIIDTDAKNILQEFIEFLKGN
nr:hypothetical protein 15 [bacterium]